MKYFNLLLFILLIASCDTDDDATGSPIGSTQPNILLIIADDLGKDAIAGFTEGTLKPNTPNLDKIRNEGLVFNNLWVNPTCSPTRASILTGKYGYRTGVKTANDLLESSEKILHQYIQEATNDAYATALIGKWHLSGETSEVNPEDFGMEYYAGLIRGAVQDYYRWQLYEEGTTSLETEYTTKIFTDLSINWINEQAKPWFLWLAYNAPHTPFHVPPAEMHSQGNLPDYEDGLEPLPYYIAAIEAVDYQIGQLLAGIPEEELENTIIIFLGDNGTPGQVAQSPYTRNTAKGSLYQGGINVPMFISGAGLSRTGEDDNLICSTDLFSTIANIAGANEEDIHDSKNFRSLLTSDSDHRNYQYSEKSDDTEDLWTISNGTFKLIVNANGEEEMYNLSADPYESNNLLNGALSTSEGNAKTELEAELLLIRN